MMAERVVIHLTYGRGVVKDSRNKGFWLLVEFADGANRWVRVNEVAAEAPRDALRRPTPLVNSGREFTARRIIEALRLGVVPYDHIDELTFGREAECRQLLEWLGDTTRRPFLVIGHYGAGKTHLLSWLYGRALQDNWAVAMVEIDPGESPFHKPKRVYSRLVRSFGYREPNSGMAKGFREFLRAAFRRGGLRDHKYFTHLHSSSDERLWEWIHAAEAAPRPIEWTLGTWGYFENRYRYLPGLFDYSTAANIYTYLISGLSWAAKRLVGLRGLLLLFDEAEWIDSTTYGYQLKKGHNFLRALIRAAAGDQELCGHPTATGLEYCGVGDARNTPFTYQRHTGLKLCLALTPFTAWEGLQTLLGLRQQLDTCALSLDPLGPQALRDTFRRIVDLYQQAYEWTPNNVDVREVLDAVNKLDGVTRCFVKGCVELLDLKRLSRVP